MLEFQCAMKDTPHPTPTPARLSVSLSSELESPLEDSSGGSTGMYYLHLGNVLTPSSTRFISFVSLHIPVLPVFQNLRSFKPLFLKFFFTTLLSCPSWILMTWMFDLLVLSFMSLKLRSLFSIFFTLCCPYCLFSVIRIQVHWVFPLPSPLCGWDQSVN